MPALVPDVRGGEELNSKQSAVDAGGHLRQELIDGVVFRPTRPVPHEVGFVTEVVRSTWDEVGTALPQCHITTTLAGRIRGWGIHQRVTDYLFVVTGMVKVVIFDGRNGSRTYGWVNEFPLSERNPGLVIIPPNLYHGWQNIGTTECILINMPNRLYDYETPDTMSLPWDSEAARRTIPYRW
jgi:dTDP-4-dehydrorhamnose 3,5-epimerase